MAKLKSIMTNEDTVNILNDLLTKAYDAEQGYEHAAQRASSAPHLVRFFENQSALRLTIGHELKSLINKYGGEPDKGASVVAKAHQIWITMRDFVEGGDNDNDAILEECERGENAAIADYDEALETPGLPADVCAALRDQRARILEALQTIRVQEAVAD